MDSPLCAVRQQSTHPVDSCRLPLDIMMSISEHLDVRTTLTLDDDVAAKLKQLSRRSGHSFRDVVNDTLRRGLASRRPAAVRPTFKVHPRDFGALRPGLSLDDIGGLLDEVEGPQHR
jgi:hypothetical protein